MTAFDDLNLKISLILAIYFDICEEFKFLLR